MTAPIRVTAHDVETGDSQTIEIVDTYVVVTAGNCVQASVQKHANGTHVITIKGSTGTARAVL